MSTSFIEASTPRASAFRKINLRILAFLTVCYCIAYVDRVNVGFAKLQMQQELGLSDAAYGLGAGIFFLGYVLLEVPSNLLLVRIGARKTLSRIMVLWGTTTVATSMASDVTTFYILRFLLGVFEAGFAPGIIYFLTRWYPKQQMGRTMAILMWALPIGSIAGGLASGTIIEYSDGLAGLSGWQWMFILEGIPALIMGFVTFGTLCESPAEASWLTSHEKRAVLTELGQTPPARPAHGALMRVATDLRVLLLALTYFGLISGIYAVGFWLPTILKTAGLHSYIEIGAYSAVPYVLTIIVIYVVGRLSDRNRERQLHAALATAVGAVGLMATAHFSDQFVVALAAISIATAGTYAGYTVFWAIPADYFSEDTAAVGIAFINTLGLFGGFFSPTVIGWMKTATGSSEAGFLAIAMLLLTSAFVLAARPARDVKVTAS
ncbi:MFS transporter [Burkholderia humptydooensis]|uniref:MFS transporter n=2 Tax=Burkholderia humptydooensis TaxID=430531 RepID=A0A7U4PBE9_9BURK|nr:MULTISPECIES: MFS transporter [Burkholderia]AJY40196.1 major Facilitator Superfamily protein [Burkholderia sp. 2002721687]ALX46349.1 MFS transporter [Burkholderia humptydooensis]EIP85772.1 major facilitator family transporter [Burkholderia humptydooensis MSMB43]QPS47855.1 MFS transporter [Burkholderia humptydooensis]